MSDSFNRKGETKVRRGHQLYLLVKFAGDEGGGRRQGRSPRRLPLPDGHQLLRLVGGEQLAEKLRGGQPNPAVGVAEVGFNVACGECR